VRGGLSEYVGISVSGPTMTHQEGGESESSEGVEPGPELYHSKPGPLRYWVLWRR